MIQRIQTIYLLITAILSGLLFFFPFQTNIVGLSEIKDLQLSLFNSPNNQILFAAAINIIIIADSITTIFLYKNRKLQMKLSIYLAIMNIVLLVLMYMGSQQVEGMPVYKLPYIIPVINILLSLMAYKNIKKDEELVRSSDRLR